MGGLRLGKRKQPATKEIQGWEHSLESAARRGDRALEHAARAEIYACYVRIHPQGRAGYYAIQAMICGLLWLLFMLLPLTAGSEAAYAKYTSAIGQLIAGIAGAFCFGQLVGIVRDADNVLAKRYYGLFVAERQQLLALTKDTPSPPSLPGFIEALRTGLEDGGWIPLRRVPPTEKSASRTEGVEGKA